MDFRFTEAEAGRRAEFKEFAREKIAPLSRRTDRECRFPRENIEHMAKRGYMGLPIPREWGGEGSDFLSYIFLIEEISAACASTGVILAVHTSVGTFPILMFGTPEQKERYLPLLARGKWLAAFALTEAGAGSDPAAIATTAERRGEHYYLNGSKLFITSGGEADVYTVFATIDREQGRGGITAFLVEKDTPGMVIGKKEKKMGMNGSVTVELLMQDAKVPLGCRLGDEGEGFRIALSLLDGGRIGIAAQGLGIASASIDCALEYTRERRQSGRALADFQGVAFVLADLHTRLEAAKLLVYRAAWLKGEGYPCTKEASMAKVYATDLAMDASSRAISLMGARGATSEYPVERYFRDAKVTQIYEGTNQIQRMVIARELNKQK